MACCKNSWKMWLYILAIIALVIGLFKSNWAMIILAVLLVIAAYLIKTSSVTNIAPKKNIAKVKPKAKKRR